MAGNPEFKPLEFEGLRNAAGANAFTISSKKWIEGTNAIGIISKSGRYGGTFPHKDIAFEFASWISAEFIRQGVPQAERLLRLNASAKQMMLSLMGDRRIASLPGLSSGEQKENNG